MLALLSDLYFVLSVLLVFATLSALRPATFGLRYRQPASFVGMAYTYFLPQSLFLGVCMTVALGLLGALARPLGFIGLILHLICWSWLARYLWHVHRSFPVLDEQVVLDADQPFCDGLSEAERDQLPPGQISWRPTFTWKIPAMLSVRVEHNVVFREVDGVRLRLDVYRPRESDGDSPCAVYIHGGGWLVGNRRQSRFMMYELAAAGWTVFSISYRLAPRFALPAAIEDAKYAIVWVREHAKDFGADGSQIVVLGGSAGGHLAAMVALSAGSADFQTGFENADTRVQGAVVLYGVTDFEAAFSEPGGYALATILQRWVLRANFHEQPELFRRTQPLSYVHGDAPPILLVHGNYDYVVPFAHSERLAQKLRDAGAQRVHLLEIPQGQHAFEVLPTPLHQRAVRVIVRFMESVRRDRGTMTSVG